MKREEVAYYSRRAGIGLVFILALFSGFARGGVNATFAILCLAFLVYIISAKFNPFGPPLPRIIGIGFLIFLASFTFNSILSVNPINSFKRLADLIYLLATFPIVLTFARGNGIHRRLPHLIAVSTIIGGGIAFYQAWPQLGVVRTPAHLGVIEYGSVLGLVIPFFAVHALRAADEKNRPMTLLFVVAIIFGMVGLIFNGLRMAWLSVGIGTIIFFGLNIRRFNARRIIALVLIIAALAAWGITRPNMQKRFFSILDFQYSANSERIELWKYGWEVFLENPVIGVGLYGLPHITEDGNVGGTRHEHVHNVILNLAAETGIIGLIGFFTLHLPILFYGLSRLRNESWHVRDGVQCVILAFSAFLMQGMTDQIFGLKPLMYMFWLILAYGWLEMEEFQNGKISD